MLNPNRLYLGTGTSCLFIINIFRCRLAQFLSSLLGLVQLDRLHRARPLWLVTLPFGAAFHSDYVLLQFFDVQVVELAL